MNSLDKYSCLHTQCFSPRALAGFFTEILQLQVVVLYMNFTYNGLVRQGETPPLG